MQQIKSLRIIYFPRRYEDTIVHLCTLKFEKLQKLDISETAVGDLSLQIIGSNCQNLR